MQLATATITPVKFAPQVRFSQTAAAEDFLRTVPMLKSLPGSLIARLAETARVVPFRRGNRIFTEGQQPNAFYIVKSGWVRTIRETPGGHGVLFDVLRPGDTVGAVVFADMGVHSTTAIAGNQTELIAIPASTFSALAGQYPELQRNLLQELGRRFRSSSDWQVQAGLGVDRRIARVLVRLVEWNGRNVNGNVVTDKSFTCQEMADLVGCAVETGIRMLSSWRAEGWISTPKGTVVIHDLNRLFEIAGTEPSEGIKSRFTLKPAGRQVRATAHRACA